MVGMKASKANLDVKTLSHVLDQIQDALWQDGDETAWDADTCADIAVILRSYHLTTDDYHR